MVDIYAFIPHMWNPKNVFIEIGANDKKNKETKLTNKCENRRRSKSFPFNIIYYIVFVLVYGRE